MPSPAGHEKYIREAAEKAGLNPGTVQDLLSNGWLLFGSRWERLDDFMDARHLTPQPGSLKNVLVAFEDIQLVNEINIDPRAVIDPTHDMVQMNGIPAKQCTYCRACTCKNHDGWAGLGEPCTRRE